ncbi:MAG: hypothetical protein U5L02_10255 [Rheinheimera sp.]|nr:hypothetical protein [Rheinheimera sp.]
MQLHDQNRLGERDQLVCEFAVVVRRSSFGGDLTVTTPGNLRQSLLNYVINNN